MKDLVQRVSTENQCQLCWQYTEGGMVGRRLLCRHNNGNNGVRGAPGIIRE